MERLEYLFYGLNGCCFSFPVIQCHLFFWVKKESSVKSMSRQSFTSRTVIYDSDPAQCTMEGVQQFDVLAQCELTACGQKEDFILRLF